MGWGWDVLRTRFALLYYVDTDTQLRFVHPTTFDIVDTHPTTFDIVVMTTISFASYTWPGHARLAPTRPASSLT